MKEEIYYTFLLRTKKMNALKRKVKMMTMKINKMMMMRIRMGKEVKIKTYKC